MREEEAAGRGEETMQGRIEIIPFKAEHAVQIQGAPTIALETAEFYVRHGIGFTAMNGKPIAAAGIVIVGPGEAEAWGLIGEEAKTKPFWLHRTVKRLLARVIAERALSYVNMCVDVTVDVSNPAAVEIAREWAKRLDFKLERTVEIYAWTK